MLETFHVCEHQFEVTHYVDVPVNQVDADYIKKKTDITERMRGILVDWLIQVHLKFKLLQETLYLTVAILDRYLSVTDIKRGTTTQDVFGI